MANAYAISGVFTIDGNLVVRGTVNGVSVVVIIPMSQVPSTVLATAVGFQQFIAPYMLADANPPSSYPTLVGSFSE
jgi:hypothetical protein